MKVSSLRASYPNYAMSKAKISLSKRIDVDSILKELEKKYSEKKIDTIDGLKILFESSWVHIRKSNTEPIIRIYTEAKSENEANELSERFIDEIEEILKY